MVVSWSYFVLFIFVASFKSVLLDRIQIKNGFFIDSFNRIKLFHGLTAINREDPWIPNKYPLDLTNSTQLDYLKNWGFNTIRLGVMWSGLMPSKDNINITYLFEINKIIDNLSFRGIYTIIDLHQDMLSSEFNSYDGMPKWLINEIEFKNSYPWPFKSYNLTLSAYLTQACSEAFQYLYDTNGLLYHYFELYWITVVNYFKNNKSILGYELINEPWVGDFYSNSQLLLPSFAAKLNLLPFYDSIYATIRKLDADTLVFYEPVFYGMLFNESSIFGSGLMRAPLNDTSRTVISWHYYCWFGPYSINTEYPLFDRIICNDIQRNLAFNSLISNKQQLNSASFLTEFGVCIINSTLNGSLVYDTQECDKVLESTDEAFESWVYFDSLLFDLNGNPINSLLNTFNRIYPQSTNGVPFSLTYDSQSCSFNYTYKLDLSIQQPTEIFIPSNIKNFKVDTTNNVNWTFDNSTSLIYLHPVGYSSKNSLLVNCQIFCSFF